MCPLAGSLTEPGLYVTLVRWWPGYMRERRESERDLVRVMWNMESLPVPPKKRAKWQLNHRFCI
jgi:hypothetical protein